jgi:hypothetical protein
MNYFIYKKSSGNIIIIVVLSITVLLGSGSLIMDLGPVYMTRTDLQKAVDTAVLSGAESLPDTQVAMKVSIETASLNYPDGIFNIIEVTSNSIKIHGERKIEHFLAKIIGIDSSLVEVKGMARIEYPYSVKDVIPFGIQDQIFVYGVPYTLKYGSGSDNQLPLKGNFGALSLGGTGSNNYREKIKYGYHGILYLGQWVDTEPGDMSGPTKDGVYYRINQDPCSNYLTVDKYSPRLVTVPIITNYDDVNGKDEVQICGFGLFFLEGVNGNGNNNYVIGRFLEKVRPTLESSPNNPNYGMKDVKLYFE